MDDWTLKIIPATESTTFSCTVSPMSNHTKPLLNIFTLLTWTLTCVSFIEYCLNLCFEACNLAASSSFLQYLPLLLHTNRSQFSIRSSWICFYSVTTRSLLISAARFVWVGWYLAVWLLWVRSPLSWRVENKDKLFARSLGCKISMIYIGEEIDFVLFLK